jgi:hypothetical protein
MVADSRYCLAPELLAALYCRTAALLLGARGLLELTIRSRSPPVLAGPDPVLLLIDERDAVVLAGSIQVATAIMLLLPLQLRLRLGAVLIVGLAFAGYRLTRFLFGVPEPCQCLSQVGRFLGLGPSVLLVLSLVFIAFLIIPGFLLLRWSVRSQSEAL